MVNVSKVGSLDADISDLIASLASPLSLYAPWTTKGGDVTMKGMVRLVNRFLKKTRSSFQRSDPHPVVCRGTSE